jgi:enoyl-CoA hydratase/carnithine racemase
MQIEGATADKTGLDIEEHGTTLIVRIDGGKHALFTRDIAAQLGDLVDRADEDPSIHAVVFTGAHPDRFLSHSDVTWLQEGGVGFPPINTRLARVVSRMARLINRLPIVRSLAGVTRLKTLLELDVIPIKVVDRREPPCTVWG